MKRDFFIFLLFLLLPSYSIAKNAAEYAKEIEQLRSKEFSAKLSSLTREAVTVHPESGSLQRMRALYLFEKKRYRLAEASFAKAIAIQPNLAVNHLFLLRCQLAQKAPKSSIEKTMKDIRDKLSGQSRHLAEAGNVLIHYRQMATAFQHFVTLLKTGSPNRWLYHLKLGQMYCLVGEWKDAANQLAKSLQLEPDYGITYYYLGKAWERQGKIDYAQTLYRKALEAGVPSHLKNMLSRRLKERTK